VSKIQIAVNTLASSKAERPGLKTRGQLFVTDALVALNGSVNAPTYSIPNGPPGPSTARA
jgi:hypothetical protein